MLLFRAFALLCLLSLHAAHAATIAVVVSDGNAIYQEFSDTLRNELRRELSGNEIIFIDAEAAASHAFNDVNLIIGLGGRAAQTLAARELKAPILLTLIPKSSFDKLPRKDEKRQSAIFIDQAPARYIDIIRVALPSVERLGLLQGRDSREMVARLMQIARDKRLRAQQENVNADTDIYPALQRLFGEGGVLLATPDASVFNSQTLPNILLSTYRIRVPVVGFSPAYVKAGALLAIYATPQQIAIQSADLARNVLAGGNLPAAQYPKLFSIGVNQHVARSLDINIDSEALLRDKLERLERQP